MDLSLTEEQQLIVDMVRRFVREEVAPLEDDLDTDEDRLPPEQFAKLVEKTKEMGLYGLGIPPEYGGPEVDVMTNTLIAIEYSQHRAGLYAPCYGAFGGAGLIVSASASPFIRGAGEVCYPQYEAMVDTVLARSGV